MTGPSFQTVPKASAGVPRVRPSVPGKMKMFSFAFPEGRNALASLTKANVGASPHLSRPTYATANVGHPSAFGGVLKAGKLLRKLISRYVVMSQLTLSYWLVCLTIGLAGRAAPALAQAAQQGAAADGGMAHMLATCI